MKSLRAIILTISIVICTNCDRNKQSTIGPGGESARPNSATTPIDADRAEALKRVEAKWNEIWVHDGDTWIAKQKEYPYLVQIKGRVVEVRAEPTSEVDRLNGIQWQGVIVVSCSAERKFGFKSSQGTISGLSDPYEAGWNEWSRANSDPAVYRLRKKNNQWAILERQVSDPLDRGEMVRPRAADLAAAGIKTTSQDSPEDAAFDKQKKSFLSWLRTYFAKAKSHEGEQTGGYHAGSVPYTFTFTMTEDPIIQMQGSRDSQGHLQGVW